MHKTKFIQILRTLDKGEFKKFGKFVRSPIFNTNKTIIKLYDALKPAYPGFNEKTVKKEKLFRKLYPQENYKDKTIRNLSSEMLKTIDTFLAFIHYESDIMGMHLNNLAELSERGHKHLVQSKYKNLKRKLENIRYKLPQDFLNEVKLNEVYKYTLFINNKNIIKNRYIFQKILNSLTEYIASLTLTYMIETKLLSSDVDHNFELSTLETFRDLLLKKNITNSNLSLNLQENLYKLLYYKDEKMYEKVKTIKNSNQHLLSDEFKQKIKNVLVTHLLLNRNHMNANKYYTEQFEIFGQIEEYFIGGVLKDNIFTNYVIMLLNLEKHDESKSFIVKYKNKLEPNIREDIANYNHAITFFAQENYINALSLFTKTKNLNWYYEINIKNYTLLCYYELKKYEEAQLLIKNYIHFLKTNLQTPGFMKRKHMNFISFMKKLLNYRRIITPNQRESLKTYLFNTNEIANKRWLLRKLSKM